MKQRMYVWLAGWLGMGLLASAAEPQPSLNPHLEPLRPLLNKTFKGIFEGSKPEKPTVDIARWERVLNGQAVRVLHSINQGIYGGETLIIWNEKAQKVEYYYFTTAGYMTTGAMEIKNGKIESRESVKGGEAGGVTEVKATSEILPGGKLHVRAEYFQKGEWALGHEVTYEPDPSAEVIFK